MSELNLHEKFLVVVEALGRTRVNELFDSALSGTVEFDNPDVQKIVLTISDKMCIAAYEIIYGNGRKNERKIAIGFCGYYLMKIHDFTLEESAEYLKKDVSNLHKCIKVVSNLNPRHLSDKKYCELREELTGLLQSNQNKSLQ